MYSSVNFKNLMIKKKTQKTKHSEGMANSNLEIRK